MSLEDALDRNTAAMEQLTEALLKEGVCLVDKIDTKEPVSEPKDKKETKKAAPPKKSTAKKPKPEPTAEEAGTETIEQGETASMFDGTGAQVEDKPAAGTAPVNEGSAWYRYTLQLCAQYSAHTGDPAKTQALCHKHKVTDLSKADDYTLSQIALEIEPTLGIKRP